jgi:hypothetical protein
MLYGCVLKLDWSLINSWPVNLQIRPRKLTAHLKQGEQQLDLSEMWESNSNQNARMHRGE